MQIETRQLKKINRSLVAQLRRRLVQLICVGFFSLSIGLVILAACSEDLERRDYYADQSLWRSVTYGFWREPALDFFVPTDKPNLLIVGDSISLGYTPYVREVLGEFDVFHIPTNAGDTRRGVVHIDWWLGRMEWNTILLNFGIHDLTVFDGEGPNVPISEYEENLRTIVHYCLRKTSARIVFLLTTPVLGRCPLDEFQRIREAGAHVPYNAAATRVMEEMGIGVLALDDMTTGQKPQDVHYTEEGYQIIAQRIVQFLRAY